MTDQFERDVRRWLCNPMDFQTGSGEGEWGLARAILHSFWSLYPEYTTRDPDAIESQLSAIACAAGYENAERLIGGSVCLGDGGRSILLSLNDGERVA